MTNSHRRIKWRTLPARAYDTVRAARIQSVAGFSVQAAALLLLTAAVLCFFLPFLSVVSTNAKDVVTETHTGFAWMFSAGFEEQEFYAEWASKTPACNLWLILSMLAALAAGVLIFTRLPRYYAAGCCGFSLLMILCFRIFFRLNYRLGTPNEPELLLHSSAHAPMLLCILLLLGAGVLCLLDGERE